MTIPTDRKRAKHAKVRSGCRTCKERRVKCDERQPICLKCEKAGRHCQGYETVAPSSSNTQDTSLRELAVSLPKSICAWPFMPTSTEQHHLDYFRLHGIDALPGSNWLITWDRFVLPLCQTEPAITHAAIAVGALQRAHYRISDSKPDELRCALVHYNQCIGAVRDCVESLGKGKHAATAEMVLTVALLLFTFEALQGQDKAAIMHLQSGLRILYESQETKERHPDPELRVVSLRAEPRSRMDVLSAAYSRLDADISLFLGTDNYLYPVCRQSVPTTLKSLEEAKTHLVSLEREIVDIWIDWYCSAEKMAQTTFPHLKDLEEEMWELLIIGSMRWPTLDQLPELRVRIDQAKQVLIRFMNALTAIPSMKDFDPSRALVEINFFYLWVLICAWSDRDEMEIDRFEDQFDHIISLAERYFEHDDSKETKVFNHVTGKSLPLAAMGTSLVQTMCLIVEMCRNSIMRRRGIEIIRKMNLQGIYNSEYLASYYEAIVELEESAAREIFQQPHLHDFESHQIPTAARIMECDVSEDGRGDDYYHQSVGCLIFVKYKDVETFDLEVGRRPFHVPR